MIPSDFNIWHYIIDHQAHPNMKIGLASTSETSSTRECRSKTMLSSTISMKSSLKENPQQGTRYADLKAVQKSEDNTMSRVPADVKDMRKLFVGGLPQDGKKWENMNFGVATIHPIKRSETQ